MRCHKSGVSVVRHWLYRKTDEERVSERLRKPCARNRQTRGGEGGEGRNRRRRQEETGLKLIFGRRFRFRTRICWLVPSLRMRSPTLQRPSFHKRAATTWEREGEMDLENSRFSFLRGLNVYQGSNDSGETFVSPLSPPCDKCAGHVLIYTSADQWTCSYESCRRAVKVVAPLMDTDFHPELFRLKTYDPPKYCCVRQTISPSSLQSYFNE